MRAGVLRAVVVGVVAVLVAGLGVHAAPVARAASVTDDVAASVAYAQQRGYRSAVAVLDMDTGGYWTAGDPDATYSSESLIKLFIATRLLVDGNMSGFNETTAYKMITQSDDASANTLYGRTGGDANIDWIKQRYGIPYLGSRPPRAGYWGATPVTAHGLASFYAAVRADPVVWPWLSNAIHHATPYGSDGFYQFFGIPSATTGAGVKQGWGNDTPSGVPEQNSTGVVGDDRYAVVILTQGPGYGGALSDVVTAQARLALPGGAVRPPGPPPRLGVVLADGSVLVKVDGLYGGWSTVAAGTADLVLSGTRVGVVDRSGTLLVKDGALDAAWVAQASGVTHLALSGNRIGVVDATGTAYVKEGGLDSGWLAVASGAAAVELTGSRVVVRLRDGSVLVKEGSLYSGWTSIGGGVAQVDADGARIGVVLTDGTSLVKDGATSAPWTAEGGGVSALTLSGTRIGAVTTGGTLLVKDGALLAPWVVEASGVSTAALAGTRIGALLSSGAAWVKDGDLYSAWVPQASGATGLALS